MPGIIEPREDTPMAANLKAVWPMTLSAPAGSLEAKQPEVDNGLDVSGSVALLLARVHGEGMEAPVAARVAAGGRDVGHSGGRRLHRLQPRPRELRDRAPGGRRHPCFLQRLPASRQPDRAERARQRRASSPARSMPGASASTASSTASPTSIVRAGARVGHRPGLTEVRCDQVGGLIFVNMDGKAPPLREWIGLPPGLHRELRDRARCTSCATCAPSGTANWKTGVDAFYETYHLPHIHPQTQGVMEDYSQYDCYPNGFSA